MIWLCSYSAGGHDVHSEVSSSLEIARSSVAGGCVTALRAQVQMFVLLPWDGRASETCGSICSLPAVAASSGSGSSVIRPL
jgi:hypothetical protein